MATLNHTPSYFSDMRIVDERLTKLEKSYEEIFKLLTGLSMDIKLIANGGNNNGIKEELDKSC